MKTRMCGKLKRGWRQRLMTGNIRPGEAQAVRGHLAECCDCFWNLSDWADAQGITQAQADAAAAREALIAVAEREKVHAGR